MQTPAANELQIRKQICKLIKTEQLFKRVATPTCTLQSKHNIFNDQNAKSGRINDSQARPAIWTWKKTKSSRGRPETRAQVRWHWNDLCSVFWNPGENETHSKANTKDQWAIGRHGKLRANWTKGIRNEFQLALKTFWWTLKKRKKEARKAGKWFKN